MKNNLIIIRREKVNKLCRVLHFTTFNAKLDVDQIIFLTETAVKRILSYGSVTHQVLTLS